MVPGFLFHQAELTIPNMPSRKNSTSLSVVSGENSHDTVDLFLRAELENCAFRDAVGFYTLAGIAEQEPSAKRDRCPDVASTHPDFVFRPGRPERLEATVAAQIALVRLGCGSGRPVRSFRLLHAGVVSCCRRSCSTERRSRYVLPCWRKRRTSQEMIAR